MFSIDVKIRENRSLLWAGIIQTFYGFIEFADVVAAVMISIGLIPNIYGSFIPNTTEVGMFMETMPVIIVPIFFFFASLRFLSGYWILQNKAKGFWLALLISVVSLFAVWFLLPLSVLDLCIILPLLILLFNGYFRDSNIVSDL